MDFTNLRSFSPFTWSIYPVICGVFLCFLTLGLYFKHSSQAIEYWIFLGSIPSLLWNSDRVFEWATEVFSSLGTGRGSFYMDGPMLSRYKFLVTCHPDNLEYILKTNLENFPKGESFREIFETLGVGIFNVDSDTWRLQRKLAHAGLRLGEFKALVAETSRKVVEEQLIPLLAHVAEEGFSIDLQDVFSRYAYDINMGMIFGRYENYLDMSFPSNEMAEATDAGQRALVNRNIVPRFVWKLQRLLRIGNEGVMIKALKMVNEYYGEYILQKKADLLAGVQTDHLLSIYIKALADSTSIFASLAKKDNYLKDEMLNLFLAGRDTIKSALTYFFWLVSTTPFVEAKILEELKSSLITSRSTTNRWPWVFRSDDLKGLVYLHAALCESLRLYPPLPLNRKSVVKKDVLPDGSVVTPGMEILLSIYSVGRMPWIWGESCFEFRPERWIAENGKLITDQTSRFLAFNIGARSCLGKDASFTQMKSVVAAVLFNFHIEVVEGHHVCPKQGTTLYMKNGLQVNIKKRTV
ncbi:alkane hydroxylase MAH1-like [Papaver somniferum]|uniref:alkane hydroxylase MAH1-like n=1 Tax=Papaver somniferum TaxID=3469 RepID=UPI000E6F6725|nr:alkane hydroxylase MAH1-like [Papaver somniferum]